MSRIVLYRYEGEFSETEAERILEPARKDGVVKQYDTGRGLMVWFEGAPGAALRKVREQIRALLKKSEGT